MKLNVDKTGMAANGFRWSWELPKNPNPPRPVDEIPPRSVELLIDMVEHESAALDTLNREYETRLRSGNEWRGAEIALRKCRNRLFDLKRELTAARNLEEGQP